jgi:hypothetical protein
MDALATRWTPVGALLSAILLLAGCTVQLTAPFSSDIEAEAGALQSDFLKFAAGMQMVAGTPKSFYDQQSARYADFEARLAVIKARSESLSGGVPCDQALTAARRLKVPVAEQVARSVSGPEQEPSASCVTILAGLAQRNMERLRGQHELRCTQSAAKILCTTLFGSPPIFSIFEVGPDGAPLVSAVAITLGELLGAEREIKPASKG